LRHSESFPGQPCTRGEGKYNRYGQIYALRFLPIPLHDPRITNGALPTMKSVVVTGASTGIGWATAKLLLDRGFRVFGSVRKQADADRLKGEFGANFTPLIFDVTDEPAVLAAAREVRATLNGEKLAGLVNNAGIAVP